MPPSLGKPKHFSYSAREQLLRCARSFFLSRIAKAPQQPSLWLAGGSAVHEVTEYYDRALLRLEADSFDLATVWPTFFGAQLDDLRRKDPNEWAWRQAKTEPVARWNELGPEFVQSYIDWRQRAPYEIWTTPDGLPAIELDVSGRLPGCPVEIKGFVDRVLWDPVLEKLIVLDLKTSQRPPKAADQFAVYAALLKVKYDVAPDLGVAFMNRKGTLAKPWDLAEFTPEAIGEVYGEAWAQIEAGDYPANPGEACRLCDTSAACAAIGGPFAATYDPDHKDYVHPPF